MSSIFHIFIISSCIASSMQNENQDANNTTTEKDVIQSIPVIIPEKYDVVASVNNLGLDVVKKLMQQNPDENIVISPTGITGLLAMTLLGSTGRTYDELARLIGFSQDILNNRQSHLEFGDRLEDLKSNETETLYANAIFVDRRSKLRALFTKYLDTVYKGEAIQIDFGDVNKATEIINGWVHNHTNGKIEEFLQQPLPHSTKAVLLTALYFSGQWSEPFVPEYTALLPFRTPTKNVMVNQMANFGTFKYIFSYEDGLQMIELPYNDSITSMYVMKPKGPKHSNITMFMKHLNFEKIEKLMNQMSKKKCVIRFPKMNVTNKIDLKDALIDLGVSSLFTPGVANFALMFDNENHKNGTEEEIISRFNSGLGGANTLRNLVDSLANPGIHVDSVMHEVKISIDEYGTEAVAATSAVMARSAELFYTDSPFFMFILNKKTKLITFSAVINDPTK